MLCSVMPGVAAVLVSIDLEPVAKVAKTYLEGYVLAKWQDTSSVCPKESYANVCYTPKVSWPSRVGAALSVQDTYVL